jgi:outer membrane receptor protein involved in Fe transport
MDVHLGVENATDKQPPLYTSSIQMNTDPSTYDVLGRRYYLRANFNF